MSKKLYRLHTVHSINNHLIHFVMDNLLLMPAAVATNNSNQLKKL